VPKYVSFTDSLPRTATGKVIKAHLRGAADL
jgi:acyl-coenzyme A synthetase/AMP-(fatty) acid ligase